jgi:hypothetical protein
MRGKAYVIFEHDDVQVVRTCSADERMDICNNVSMWDLIEDYPLIEFGNPISGT